VNISLGTHLRLFQWDKNNSILLKKPFLIVFNGTHKLCVSSVITIKKDKKHRSSIVMWSRCYEATCEPFGLHDIDALRRYVEHPPSGGSTVIGPSGRDVEPPEGV
jgi:hypothetical protein